ncbi:MAG: TrmH family RNA methyltransferase [Candidatus Paceibacterota bacterium]
MSKEAEKVLLLHNIRSSENVGALFRTADAIGIDAVYLIGYTPAPIDRFGRKEPKIAKAALGSEKSLVWEQRENIFELIKMLKEKGFEIVALEQDKHAIDYKKYIPGKKLALIVGNEVVGIEEEVLNLCDHILEIPMRGEKESLNVSVATGIALFRILDHPNYFNRSK